MGKKFRVLYTSLKFLPIKVPSSFEEEFLFLFCNGG